MTKKQKTRHVKEAHRYKETKKHRQRDEANLTCDDDIGLGVAIDEERHEELVQADKVEYDIPI